MVDKKSPTGRLVRNPGPNLQNIPLRTPEMTKIREAFIQMTLEDMRRVPNLEKGEDYKTGQWVLVIPLAHRIGMVGNVTPARVEVRFGAAGPNGYYSRNSIYWATQDDVRVQGKTGVGYVGSPYCPE